MNRILNIIIALIAVLSGYCTALAQGDAPLVREGVKWRYIELGSGPETSQRYLLYFQGTETINDKEYKVCYRQDYNDSITSSPVKIALLRQDEDKVFLYRSKTDLRTYPRPSYIDDIHLKESEILIYDFSLDTGQSWKMMADYPEDLMLSNAGWSNKKEVDSVKYIQIQGVDTKVQYVQGYRGTDYYIINTTEVISGIGCTQKKLFPFPYLGSYPLSIDFKHPTLVSFEDEYGNVLWKHLGVSSVEESGASMTMEDDLLSVTAEGAWTVMVYGSDGRKVMQRKGYGTDAIALDGLGAGIYIARLQTASAAKTLKLIR